jgi:hypothetical protein
MQTIEAEAKFVDEVVANTVDLAGSQALGCVVAVAILKPAAVERVAEGRGQEGTVVSVRKPRLAEISPRSSPTPQP